MLTTASTRRPARSRQDAEEVERALTQRVLDA